MELFSTDTIAAPITAPGHAAVSVVRVSGSKTRSILEALCEQSKSLLDSPRTQVLTAIADKTVTPPTPLDHALVCYFAAPNTFTGEDCAEFALHGSPFLVTRLLDNLRQLGVRGARPGEFTERAFHNGRVDLTQAEAIADLISAETEAQARVAREQLEGKISQAITQLGEPLRDLLAEIEAHIDFPEEGIDPLTAEGWLKVLTARLEMLNEMLLTFRSGKLYREGASVVLVGLPNAGKSSLLNRLVGEDRAIVTPIPGTTRDSIEERIVLEGLAVRLWDTAGLADLQSSERTPDTVEKLGIERSWKHAERADLVLYLYDLNDNIESQKKLIESVKALNPKLLIVGNKSDLVSSPSGELCISASTGAGIKELKAEIIKRLLGEERSSSVLVTTQRHFDALSAAHRDFNEALAAIQAKKEPEIVSLLLRSGLGKMEDIIGITTTEDILGRIFSKFCIGK